jgi:hypothetical protein
VKQAVERAVRAVEGRKVRPVDPREASKGRLDYAQVRALFLKIKGNLTGPEQGNALEEAGD